MASCGVKIEKKRISYTSVELLLQV